MRVINLIALSLIASACYAQTTVQFIRGPGTIGGGSPNDLLTGLIAFWEMEEPTGDILDSHTGNRTLTENGVVVDFTGIRNNARSFSASDSTDALTRASEAGFTFGSGDFTITAWASVGSLSGDGIIICKSNGSASWMLIYDDLATDAFSFYWSTDGVTLPNVVSVVPSGGVLQDTWYFVSVRRSGGTVYISATSEADTVLSPEAFTTVSGTLFDNSAVDLAVGADSALSAASDFGGVIDEVGIWKGLALSVCQLESLFNASAALDYSLFNNTPVDCGRLLNQNGFAILNQNGDHILLQ